MDSLLRLKPNIMLLANHQDSDRQFFYSDDQTREDATNPAT